MKVCSKCKEEKDLSLFHKARTNKDGYQFYCKACRKRAKAIYYQANKERLSSESSKWAKNNRDKRNLSYAKWRDADPERCRLLGAKWRAANPDKVCAKTGRRRAVKLKATPAWADQKAIQSWYTLAKMFDKTFGEKHHVDHIVPLRGKDICGLHVEYNLQVLTATENIRKGNRYEA